MTKKIYEYDLSGRKLQLEIGEMAQFANGSVLVRYGDTTILSTVTASAKPREGLDFFPLSVDYEEKMYSIGKIPGGYLKREGRPSENAVLIGRSIDRALRPLFPEGLRNDVIISNLVLSVDHDNSPQVAAFIGSSAALMISDIPWDGPLAGMQVGIVDDEIIVNPDNEQTKASTLDLFVAGSKDKVCMIEAGANEVTEDDMMGAIIAGHKEIANVCNLLQQMQDEIGKEKFSFEAGSVPTEVFEVAREFLWDKMRAAVLSADKAVRDENLSKLNEELHEHLTGMNEEWDSWTSEVLDMVQKAVVRDYLFHEKKRVDGRALDEIRPLSGAVDVLPRVHGSGLFQRGQTQVLTVTTLGTLSDCQRLDGIIEQDRKRYIHHYNFPSYSVGEARPSRSPGRRELGHGALAERALLPVLPSEDDFPYAIRNVSEITMSNGSTSQGAVCSSTLALMAAGVPISKPVAGISSGLIVNPQDDTDYLVFMDIQGIEDFFGDMDFKVAGTGDGITAIQVDIKVDGLSYDMIRDALELTRKGRLQIINETILPTISEPRAELSEWAPKIEMIDIPADKIREVIGSGGKVIRRIQEETGAEIDIEEDGPIGHVYIASPNLKAAAEAIKQIKAIALDPEPGTVFEGVVTRLMPFGAFVEIAPGKEGLVHISKMSWERTEKVEDVVEPGQTVQVIVSEVDAQGRLNLSMRDLMEKPEGYRGGSSDQEGRRDRRDVDRSSRGNRDYEPRRDSGRRSGGRDSRSRDDSRRSGGQDSRQQGGDRRSGGRRDRRNENNDFGDTKGSEQNQRDKDPRSQRDF
ncbi:MAG TPA: polyribonucleotide nucleotidyltransferase [Clostridiaceae bacterium]|nr:polyribonucleotide nucleotidyltransferase [Clostridiaceae bacterium]